MLRGISLWLSSRKSKEHFGKICASLAQQAAEKALKAVYQSRALPFRYIHDLEELGKGLEDAGIEVPSEVKEAIILTRYAVETRYPGIVEPITEEEYQSAIHLAEEVVMWAETLLEQEGK